MLDRGAGPAGVILFSLAILTACGGGGGGGGGGSAGTMELVEFSVEAGSSVALNTIFTFEFSREVRLASVGNDTILIREGPNYAKQAQGRFDVDGRFVRFYPNLPIRADLADCGLLPGRGYRITVPGYPAPTTVTALDGDRVAQGLVVDFDTWAADSPSLFRDNFLDAPPPGVGSSSPVAGATGVSADIDEIRLTFARRALHPATVTAENITLVMLSRKGVTTNRPVPGTLELVQRHDRVEVFFRPTFPMADDAVYELKVEGLKDLVGEEVPDFRAEFTVRDEMPRDGEAVWEFDAAERDTEFDIANSSSSWSDLVEGALCGVFTAAGGDGTAGDLAPDADVTLTPDDFEYGVRTEVEDGVEYDVYNFRSIEIPAGVTVRFEPPEDGPNRPVKVLSLLDIKVDGTLTVSGKDGANGELTLGTATMSVGPGGDAGPGGGDGGTSYTGTRLTDAPRPGGYSVDFGGEGGEGGGVGQHNTQTGTFGTIYSYGGGGGGGGSRQAGTDGEAGGEMYDPTQNGEAGEGGDSATERGYEENEERRPSVGGAGGGAGGKGFTRTQYNAGFFYLIADMAGAGGGGGGALVLQSGGDLRIGSAGGLLARGGDGGNTSAASQFYGGAGGGGAGGSILVRATDEVVLAPGSTLDVAGGVGGGFVSTYTFYAGGRGGDGGDGYIRLEAGERTTEPGEPAISLSGTDLTYAPVSEGLFTPKGKGEPSVGQTLWRNLGVFDAVFSVPADEDVEEVLNGVPMDIEVQMAIEDPAEFEQPDLSALDVNDEDADGRTDDTLNPLRLSEWTPLDGIEALNGKGYRFLRIRVNFRFPDDHDPKAARPYLERLRIPFRF